MTRGNWVLKLAGFAVVAAFLYHPVGAREDMGSLRHFEVSLPEREAPKLVAVTLPEERSLRTLRIETLLVPIEPDPASEITLAE